MAVSARHPVRGQALCYISHKAFVYYDAAKKPVTFDRCSSYTDPHQPVLPGAGADVAPLGSELLQVRLKSDIEAHVRTRVRPANAQHATSPPGGERVLAHRGGAKRNSAPPLGAMLFTSAATSENCNGPAERGIAKGELARIVEASQTRIDAAHGRAEEGVASANDLVCSDADIIQYVIPPQTSLLRVAVRRRVQG